MTRTACIIIIGLVAILALTCAGYANELDNPCYELGGLGWETSGPEILFNAGNYEMFTRMHIAYDPGGAWLRQICDNKKSPGWNDNYHMKQITLGFDVYNEIGSSVDVYIDYLPDSYNTSDTKPTGVTYLSTYLGNFSDLGWTTISRTITLGTQPRWCGPRFVFNLTGDADAAVDTASLTSVCVPEPSGLIALASGLFGLLGLVNRRRK